MPILLYGLDLCALTKMRQYVCMYCMHSFIKVSDKPQQPDMHKNRKVKTTKIKISSNNEGNRTIKSVRVFRCEELSNNEIGEFGVSELSLQGNKKSCR